MQNHLFQEMVASHGESIRSQPAVFLHGKHQRASDPLGKPSPNDRTGQPWWGSAVAHIDAAGSGWWRLAPEHVNLLAKSQDLRFTPHAGLEQSNERTTKQSEQLDHRATASPDSHRFASYMEFPTGTGAVVIKLGDEVIGSIGTSGAPGAKLDDNCARARLEKIRNRLKSKISERRGPRTIGGIYFPVDIFA